MNNYYVEMLIKRDIEDEKKKRKIVVLLIISIIIAYGIISRSLICGFLFVLSLLIYYFFVQKYYIEYEYFYMNGELSISKIINKSRRRNVMELNDRMIRLVAALGSAELEEFYDLKKLDFTANNPFELPYVIVFEVNGVVKAMNIQMNDELYKSLKYNMPSKVKKNKCECYFWK